ncbi:MAG: signal peptidase I [Caulobacter sp.]|nr:signal peptidase I [Caulobacter sp.]
MTDDADEAPTENTPDAATAVVEADAGAPGDETPAAVSETVEIIKTVVYALLIALVLRIFVFQPFTIPSSSMRPNLLIGDYVIVSKFSYGYSKNSIPFSPPLFKGRLFEGVPKRGDVIVFKTPAQDHKDLIKRLIGLPGDTIQVTNGVLSVNGRALPKVADGMADGDESACPNGAAPLRFWETNPEGRRYITYDCGTGDLDNTDVYVVPAGHYFFMGDNRDNSLDSRVAAELGGVGYVPAENLMGKAETVLASWRQGAALYKPWTWVLNLRWNRFFHSLKAPTVEAS